MFLLACSAQKNQICKKPHKSMDLQFLDRFGFLWTVFGHLQEVVPSSDEMLYYSIATQNMDKSHTGPLCSHTKYGQKPHKINVSYLVWFLMKATQVSHIATQDMDKSHIGQCQLFGVIPNESHTSS